MLTASSQPHRTHGRILVVDDEHQMLAVTKAILNAHGMEVVATDCGAQALQLFQESLQTPDRFSVVVLDLTMPGGLSGFEVMEQLHKVDPDLCVIACSGFFQEDARDLCQAIGFTDVLQKPYTLEHLVATVRRGLAKDRATHDTPA
ncbi:response regulator receiver domain-containing protein [Prosthecobacter fusiformis]|uniref:Response regulator receiver domain-containing protein n=1 Tax=Prosthecobacter fusiformis TaxID=48464 RepID=A0A4V6Q5G4_9BACT|nr:response regulator [Prosthecobacter fusiformis]TDU73223.1 response regulator receiver domain-containing protein [Prosthecobacter fusiformis]